MSKLMKKSALDYISVEIDNLIKVEGTIQKTSVYGGQISITFKSGNNYSVSVKKNTNKVTLD